MCPICGQRLIQRRSDVLENKSAWHCERNERSCERYVLNSVIVNEAVLNACKALDRDEIQTVIEKLQKAQAVLDARKRDRISGVYKKTPATHFLYGKVFCARCGAPYKRRTLSGGTADGAPVYHKVWNCRERQKGKAGNGCRNTSVAEEELLRGISDALGWEWKGAEEFGTERFLREVQAVHLENGAASVQKWTQRVSA